MASPSPSSGKHQHQYRSPQTPSPIPIESFTSQTNNIYKVDKSIGKGGYGVVYACYNNDKNYFALKTSRSSSIALEVAVMKEAEKRKCRHFGRLFDQGWADVLKLSFLVMDLLGPSLSELKTHCQGQRFSPPTVYRVGMQTLNAIEELHECGFISRDVKPSNFVTSPPASKRSLIYMIDFGISKQYKDLDSDTLYPPKFKCSFRGTSRYCSINNHLRQDQGRRDDTESWCYMIIEFANGRLPWSKMTRMQKNEIYCMKLSMRKHMDVFLGKLPRSFGCILDKNDAMNFESKPDYGMIYSFLDTEYLNLGISYSQCYDWECVNLQVKESPSPCHSNTPTSLNNNLSENEVVATQEETDK